MYPRPVQLLFAALARALFFGGLTAMRSRSENWGATPAEQRQTRGGDEIVPDAVRTATMANTIDAPTGDVWPWVAQFGAGRGGLYTYDWFERLIQCTVVDSPTIVPELQRIKPGDSVRMCAGDFGPPGWTVAAVAPGSALILGRQDDGGMWVSTSSLVLMPIDARSSRLFWRNRDASPSVFDTAIGPGIFVMLRGVLVGIKERAEGHMLPWYARESELLFWLVSFLAFVVPVVATAVRRRWQLPLFAALVAAFVTLVLVPVMPPLWLDVAGALLVGGVVAWSCFTRRTWGGRGLRRYPSARPLGS